MSGSSLTESQFQSRVLKFLQDEGAYLIKYWGGGRFTKAGVPDIIANVAGLFVGIELKTETGRTSKLQDYNLERIRDSGGIAFVLRPSDFADFQVFVRRIKKEVKACNIHIPEFPLSSNVGGDSSSSTSKSFKPSPTRRRTTP